MMVKSLVRDALFFLPGVPSSLNYVIAEFQLNHCKASLVFSTSLSVLIILLLPEFFMKVRHDGSSRI